MNTIGQWCIRGAVGLIIDGWLAGTGALAQGPPPDTGHSEALIKKYDQNGDGKLSDTEIEAARPSENAGKRTNQDLSFTAQDRVESSGPKTGLVNDEAMQALLERFDSNKNGKLDLDEMDALRKSQKKDP